MREFKGNVFITLHARDRFIQRRIELSNNANNKCNVYKKMLNMIFRSKLIKFIRKPDGRISEYRENKGCIFICERINSKNFWEKDSVTVITVELSKTYIVDRIDRGYDVSKMQMGAFMENRLLN